MLIEHETKTILEKRKGKVVGMRSRPQLYRAVFAGEEEFPALEGIVVESLMNWQFSATGDGQPHLSYF
jgi:hypothetical protein